MKTEIKILRALLEDRSVTYTIREIARKIGSDYRITHTAAKNLESKQAIVKRTVGKSSELRLSGKFSEMVFAAEYEKRQALLKNTNLKLIWRHLSELNFPFIGLIFGSYAKGVQTKNSDFDLMVICEEKRMREVESSISILALDIHLIDLTVEDFIVMAKSKEFTVVSEAMKTNVLLFGIEDYYRILENAK